MSSLILTAEERKTQLVDKLSTQYSHNNISLEEYERLIKYSQNIETDKELIILEKLIEGHETVNVKKDENIFPDIQPGIRNSQIDNSPINHFNLLSSRKTTGPLTGGNIMNILGEHKIIITEDDLVNNDTMLNVMVVLGTLVLHVPDNVDIKIKVNPLLSEVKIPDNIRNKNSRKSITITGSVILGEVKVKVR